MKQVTTQAQTKAAVMKYMRLGKEVALEGDVTFVDRFGILQRMERVWTHCRPISSETSLRELMRVDTLDSVRKPSSKIKTRNRSELLRGWKSAWRCFTAMRISLSKNQQAR